MEVRRTARDRQGQSEEEWHKQARTEAGYQPSPGLPRQLETFLKKYPQDMVLLFFCTVYGKGVKQTGVSDLQSLSIQKAISKEQYKELRQFRLEAPFLPF